MEHGVPVRHRSCGGVVGQYLGGRETNIVRSKDFLRLDGTQPAYGERINERCPHCGGMVASAMNLKRCFDEVA